MKKLIVIASLLLWSGLPGRMALAKETKPPISREWHEKGTLQATVVKVNQKTRLLTLRGADGTKMSAVAGPEVKNFDQIKKGDTIVINYSQETVISVRKPGSKEAGSTQEDLKVQSARKGEKPQATLTGSYETEASVEAINYETRSVTLKESNGDTRTVQVGPQVTRFNELKKGDIIVINVTKSVEIQVTPPASRP